MRYRYDRDTVMTICDGVHLKYWNNLFGIVNLTSLSSQNSQNLFMFPKETQFIISNYKKIQCIYYVYIAILN